MAPDTTNPARRRGSPGGRRGARAVGPAGAREGAAGLARPGPEGARRRLRPERLCAEPAPDHRPLRDQQRGGARAYRRAQAAGLRLDTDRRARSLRRQDAERAGPGVHPRRRLARGPRQGLRHARRDVRGRRSAFRRRSTSTMSSRPTATLCRWREQVRSAVAWVCKNAASFGGDPNRVYVSGHSSGGHLAGVVARHRLEQGLRPAARCGEGRGAAAPACSISSRCGSPSAASM